MQRYLRKLREKRDMTRSELAKKLGTHEQQIYFLENGSRKLHSEWIEKLAKALNVSNASLVTNVGDVIEINVRGSAAAGVFSEPWAYSNDDTYSVLIPKDDRIHPSKAYAVEVHGDSMNQIYPDNSIAVIMPLDVLGEVPVPGRRYLVERNVDGATEITLKQLEQRGDELWLIPKSDNPAYQPVKLTHQDNTEIKVIGRVMYSIIRE